MTEAANGILVLRPSRDCTRSTFFVYDATHLLQFFRGQVDWTAMMVVYILYAVPIWACGPRFTRRCGPLYTLWTARQSRKLVNDTYAPFIFRRTWMVSNSLCTATGNQSRPQQNNQAQAMRQGCCRLPSHVRKHAHSFGLAVCAFLSTGSIFVAFMTSPLIFNFPDMNSRCACVFPATNFANSSSDSDSVTGGIVR